MLEALKIKKMNGNEMFSQNGDIFNCSLLQFWQWSGSDILNNTARGVLAEFIVAYGLGITEGVRTEWDAYDLETCNGIKIEIKSAAYLQSWKQESFSSISFSIAPTHGWNAKTSTTSKECVRQSDIYVFCLLAHTEKMTVNPLNLDQWEFFIVPTKTLNEKLGSQKRISLSRLKKLHPHQTKFGEIEKTIKKIWA